MSSRRYVWPGLALLLGVAIVVRLTTAGEDPEQIRQKLADNLQQKNYRASLTLIAQNMDVFLDARAKAANENLSLLKSDRFPLLPLPQLLPKFLNRREFYADVARDLKRDTPRQTVLAVLDYVTGEVASVAGPAEKSGIGVLPETVLYRGYGVCDRSAWLFCTLLQNLGVPSYVVYLIDPETDTSPHTVAAAELDGKLYLFDTYAGMPVCGADGSWACFKDAVAGTAGIDEYQVSDQHQLVTQKLLQKSFFFLPFEPETIGPLASILQSAAGPQAPALFFDYRSRLLHLGSMLFKGQVEDHGTRLKSADQAYQAGLWDYPFRVTRNSVTPAYAEEFRTAHTWLPYCFRARGKHFRGQHQQEQEMLKQIAEDPDADESLRAAAKYFVVSCKLETSADDALAAADDYFGKYPESIWISQLHLSTGEYLMQQGNFALAMEHLQQVSGPRKLRAAALLQAARHGKLPEILSAENKKQAEKNPPVTRQVVD